MDEDFNKDIMQTGIVIKVISDNLVEQGKIIERLETKIDRLEAIIAEKQSRIESLEKQVKGE